MKKNLIYLIGAVVLTTSCAYQRIGDLTMISNRNVDTSKEYVLLQRNVEVKVKSSKRDALEKAIDKATESVNAEHLMNVKIFVKNNGAKIKVIGDAYGIKPVPAIGE